MKANIIPSGNLTGFKHPKCYASADENCCENLSKEHFISASLLRQLEDNNAVKIAGLRWQEDETFNNIPINGLAPRVLCERHNNALSPLDAAMNKFTLEITKFETDLNNVIQSAESNESIHWGDDIERWVLKYLLGAVSSGNINHKLRPECLDLLYDRVNWVDGWGLYFCANVAKIHYSSSLAIEHKFNPNNNEILKVNLFLHGIPFSLCLGKPDNPSQIGIWRPSSIIFSQENQQRKIVLKWSNKSSGKEIRLDRVGSYDGPSPEWKGWEQRG